MKKNNTSYFSKASAFLVLLLWCQTHFAQVAYRQLEGFGQALTDINDSGQATQNGGVYDFQSDTTTPADAEVYGLSGINNNGDLIGTMPYSFNGQDMTQPAYKKDGIWHPMGYFPNVTTDAAFSFGQISENGTYIAGQMSPDCCDYQAFLYNTTTGILERIADPANEYGAGYTVNNNGILGGWYDPQPEGTLRVPAYMTTGSVLTSLPPGQPESEGQISAINNNNVMVGDRLGVPFMYDQTANTYTEFQVPSPYETATFTSVSDTGVAVGYAQIWTPDGPIRDAIVYHPNLGAQPIFIKEILSAHGIEVTTFDGKLGTAIAISPDGNYVCGWDNSFFFFATGWAVNFDDLLMSSCYIICPQDVVAVSLNGPKVVDYELNVNCNSNPNTSLVLVSGLASGSEFPFGTTEVVHQLVDENGTVLNVCTFNVIVTDQYCSPEAFGTIEPITRVVVAGIDHSSAVDSVENFEDFTDVIGNVNRESDYATAMEGFTGGPYMDFFTAYIDWNKDGDFGGANERYELGSVTESTGVDGQQAIGSIAVPADAVIGNTTMRIVKTYDAYAEAPCAPGSGYGQVEDYTLTVSEALATTGFSKNNWRHFPNPVKEVLTVSNDAVIEKISVYNVLGQEVFSKNTNSATASINLSALPSGNYLVKAVSGTATQTFKIIKY
ncbi:GEVED domain-containing protein [Flavobacterium sp.]|uniref:T9SS type A sorting domain-containing protein n=1 Tax=Flavobacterium sp. TaxID=239 RepID=UPI0039E376C2